ncbi:MAG: hypothetical protein K2X36_08520, partial [Microbacteriaceae bacterium]|nr:hypothetical protein [Microbacteriaceae bacterium]
MSDSEIINDLSFSTAASSHQEDLTVTHEPPLVLSHRSTSHTNPSISLERVLPLLRPLSEFKDVFTFLDTLNRTFRTLNLPTSSFRRLLAWALAQEDSRLADFVESFEQSVDWETLQSKLIDRVEGPGAGQRRILALLQLTPVPGQTFSEFFRAFSQLSARIPTSSGAPLPLEQIFSN